MPVATARVVGRRVLRFASLDEVLAEAERLAIAPRVTMLGNWTLGQTLGHLAAAMQYSVDGANFRRPWYLGVIGPFLKHLVLRKMPAGFRLPEEVERIGVPTTSLTPGEGLARLREGVDRLSREPTRAAHFVFGRLTPQEWTAFHCRHAELHLSFAVEEAACR
ncbi:MAG: DUF1569 domain-containing protein [Pirellulaceae bacterium]